MRNSRTIPCLLMLALSACISPQAAKERQLRLQASDNAECARQGAKPGSPAYNECLLRLRELRLDQRRADTTVVFNPYRGTPDENFLH